MKFLKNLFPKQKRIKGKIVDLVEEQIDPASELNQYVKSYYYGIYLHDSFQRIGNCDLREGNNAVLYYAGNIGYQINPLHRGHHYAYQACLLLFDLAREKGMKELIITCSPENTASRRILESLNGTFLETVDVPPSHWLYQRGEKIKRIYKYDLSGAGL